MTLTQMIGDLERDGWRFRLEDRHYQARQPKPRPANAEEVITELRKRKTEVSGFLHARGGRRRHADLSHPISPRLRHHSAT